MNPGKLWAIIKPILAGDRASLNDVHDGLICLLKLECCSVGEGVVFSVSEQARKWDREWTRLNGDFGTCNLTGVVHWWMNDD